MAGTTSEWSDQSSLVSDMVRKLKSDIDQVEQRVHHIKSGLEVAPGVRSATSTKVHQLIQVARDLCEEIRSLARLSQGDTERGTQLRSLENRAIAEASRLQHLSRDLQSNFRAQQAQNKSHFGDSRELDVIAPTGAHLQLQFEDDAASQAQMEEERAMSILEDDILKVNEVFSTLAGLVHEQGTLVDSIEAQVDTAHVQVMAGAHHLTNAVRHRNASRRKKIICGAIVLVVLLVVVIILIIALRNS